MSEDAFDSSDDATPAGEQPARVEPVSEESARVEPQPELPAGELSGAPGSTVEQALDPGWIPAELFAYRVMVVPMALTVGGVVAWAMGLDLWAFAAGLLAAVFAYWLLVSLARALVRRQFAATSWMVDDAHLRIRKGVWWRKELHVPRTRIQHTDVTQGPLQRNYGVATLVVHTAGTAYSTVSLDGLTHARAQQLRDKLVLEDGDDGV